MAAKERKRAALTALRELAEELGLPVSRRKVDLSGPDFTALHAQVLEACTTEPQRSRAADALSRFRTATLPPLPVAQGAGGPAPPAVAPPASAAASAPAPETESPGEFRLRSTSCLFTWNNTGFANWNLESLWATFLLFLRGLHFVIEWTATMERSLQSKEQGRVHLHAFVEFKKAPDWTSLEAMRFLAGLPNASPTRARGDNIRVVKDQGHFYAWAWKEGTLYVATSGYEPWKDYAVKGLWIDDLWTQHKLSHDVYLEYAAQVRVGYVNRAKQVEAVRARERSAAQQKRRSEDHPPLKMKSDGGTSEMVFIYNLHYFLGFGPYPIRCIILGPGEMKFMGSGSVGRWEMKQRGPTVTPSPAEGDLRGRGATCASAERVPRRSLVKLRPVVQPVPRSSAAVQVLGPAGSVAHG